MDETKAREILGEMIQPDNSLLGGWIRWSPGENNCIEIDTALDLDEMEAIAWWMRNKNK